MKRANRQTCIPTITIKKCLVSQSFGEPFISVEKFVKTIFLKHLFLLGMWKQFLKRVRYRYVVRPEMRFFGINVTRYNPSVSFLIRKMWKVKVEVKLMIPSFLIKKKQDGSYCLVTSFVELNKFIHSLPTRLTTTKDIMVVNVNESL